MQNAKDPLNYAAMASALQESEERYRQLVDTHPDALVEEAARQAMEALRKREAQLQGLLAHSPSVVFIKDCEGRFEFINRAYEMLYDVRSEDLVGKTDYDLFAKEIADGFRTNDLEVMRTAQSLEAEEIVPIAGGFGTHHSVKFPILAESGEVTGVCGIATDITLRRQAEIAIAHSEARMAEAQRISRVGSWEFDVATQQIVWSEELFRQFGLDPHYGAPDAKTYMTFYHPDDAALLAVCGQRAIQEGVGGSVNLRGAVPEGVEPPWYHIILDPVRDAEGTVVRLVGTHMDITERTRIEQQLQAANQWLADANAQLERHIARINEQTAQLERQKAELQVANIRLEALATTDGLTGLKNHRAFQDQLREEVERATRYGTPLSMLMLDVDRFKAYNDTFGHPAGDTVLRTVAEILRTTSRVHDFVARYGGEEFAIILTEADNESAIVTAERLRAAIEAAPWLETPVTASFGVATLSLAINDTTSLIAQADTALYASKHNGRNCVTSLAFPAALLEWAEVSA